jgi:hypothetical protein
MKKDKEQLEKIRAYLKGQMEEQQRMDFEKKLSEDENLREEVEWMRLMLQGLTELEKRKAPKKRKRRGAIPLLMVLFLILAGISLSILFRKNRPAAPEGDHSISPVAAAWQADGSILISGNFWVPHRLGDFSLQHLGKSDGFLASYAPGEGYQWVKTFGSPGLNDRFSGVDLDDNGNILLAGTIGTGAIWGDRKILTKGKDNEGERDFFVAKLTSSGELIWIDHYGGVAVPDLQTGDNLGFAVSSAPGDKVVATAAYIGAPVIQGDTLPSGGPNEDVLLYQYNASGQIEWYKSITGDYMINARSLHVDEQGYIYLTGFFGHHNLGGTARFDSILLKSYGGRDIFIARYDPAGQLDWVRQAGSSQKGNDFGQDIATTPDGRILLTGWFEEQARFDSLRLTGAGERDGFVACYGQDGSLQWAIPFGGEGQDCGNKVSADQNGNCYLAGIVSRGEIAFGRFAFEAINETQGLLAKLDPAGDLLWLKSLKGDIRLESAVSAGALSIDQQGNSVISGTFSGTLEFDGNRWESLGKEDLFILWLDPDGNFLRLQQVPIA